MTTKPKARKFRIRKSGGASTTGPDTDAQATGAATADTRAERPAPATEDGFANQPFPGSAAYDKMQAEAADATPERPQQDEAEAAPPPPAASEQPASGAPTAEQELAAIRAEGLTGRQLRMARRIAQKHGLAPSSDFDAVRLLRHRGVDPFARGGKLELVVDTSPRTPATASPAQDGAPSQATGQRLPAAPRPTQPVAPPTPAAHRSRSAPTNAPPRS
jgi:capsular polysaccharide transport system permease protein